MKIKTLEELFIHELSDMLNAEKQMTAALPKMAKAATDKALADAFTAHFKETEIHVKRIEKAADSIGITLKREKCDAMEGLITEGKEAIDGIEKGPVLDVALIAAAQKVEHYEISGYGTLIELAKLLNYKKAVEILSETLNEEKSTDEKLTVLATGGINDDAAEMAKAA